MDTLGNIHRQGIWRFFVVDAPVDKHKILAIRDALRRVDLFDVEAARRIVEGIALGKVLDASVYKNVITTAGRERIGNALAGNITSIDEIKITHEELGTGTTAPSASDTGLETPVASTRQSVSSVGVSGTDINITSFWSAGTADGTWKEYGLFLNGSATSNSGVLFVRVAIDKVVSGASLVIDGTITQTN